MGSFATKGLTLFMEVSQVKNPLHVFETMLSTARELVEDLGGELVDETRQPLTADKIARWRLQLIL
jgi:cell division protein ZipA